MTVQRETRIDSLELCNYRKFANITIDFHPKLTVLAAVNGGGKTALLDATAIALRHFVAALRGSSGHGFGRGDVRLAMAPTGAMVPVSPTSLLAKGVIDGLDTTWRRELASPEGKTTYGEASELSERARGLRYELGEFADKRRTDPPMLPLIAYYGTGRLWSEHKLTERKKKAATDLTVQTGAYLDCLSPSSSYSQFVVWFENVVREAQNEQQTGIVSPHAPQQLLAAVRGATDAVLRSSGWVGLDWDFLASDLVAVHATHGRLPVSYLSDGIRNLIALVADLAHRAVRLNPHLGAQACESASGIVLIDEVDMHLHPSWQQTVVGSLQSAFPNIQFIVTTHSHLVVSTVPMECIRIVGDDGSVPQPTVQTQGADSPFALSEVFGVDSMPPVEIVNALSDYRFLVEQGKVETDEAKRLWTQLVAHFGEHHPSILEVKGIARLQRFKSSRGTEDA